MITFTIDNVVPCLKKVSTGDIIETEVIRIRRKSFLSKFNERTGWYVNWSKFDDDVEIYALVLKGTVDIQGLIALKKDAENSAVNIVWAVTSPDNNSYKYETKVYEGVGGHLFAIAGRKSMEWGFDGFVYGKASDKKILEYYINNFNAYHLPSIDPFAFYIDEEKIKKVVEVYNYEDNNEEL